MYRDHLSWAALKRKAPLKERDANLLRENSRTASGEVVYVASLTVLAWDNDDLLAVIMRLAARHETLTAIAEKVSINPVNTDLDALKTAFRGALRRFSAKGVTGGEASGKKRKAEAQAKIAAIRPYWGLSSVEYPTKTLCEEHGVSRPTAFLYLGSRADAQQRHKASLATAESNRRRKQRGTA